jgi:phosphatidylserine decarboxylase
LAGEIAKFSRTTAQDAGSRFGSLRTLPIGMRMPTGVLARVFQQEDLNFLLTNRIPRRLATRMLGRLARIESPAFAVAALRIWKLFAPELDLSESRSQRFRSLRECFIRELAPGTRPIAADPRLAVSPCDAVVGACGRIEDGTLIQAKGLSYRLSDLLGGDALVPRYRAGSFATLRLKATMYHRFHAPAQSRLREVTHIAGDTWNLNPIAVARIERLFCRNERAVLPLELEAGGGVLTLVAVAAIGVATLRLHCLDASLGLRYAGPTRIPCDARYAKGDELGWFEQGSTIIALAEPALALAAEIRPGRPIRVGEPLFRKLDPRERA